MSLTETAVGASREAPGAHVINMMSVDVEEYFHAMIVQEALERAPRTPVESRVRASVERVLALFARFGTRATFFVLGELAIRYPEMVRAIAAAGHEIACHSFRHEPVWRQRPDEFRRDVRRARAVLEAAGGVAVMGFRAPNFSIGDSEQWAYDVLLEEGYRYDSSVYPIRHDRYGDPHAPRWPHALREGADGSLLELPIGTLRLLGVNLPLGGGGYFRLLPADLYVRGIRRVNARERQPVMFYFHPWELDPAQPRVPMRWHHRARHYVNLGREEAKLETLLKAVPFGTAREALGLA